MRRRILMIIGLILVIAGSWLGLTGNMHIWPVRNTLQYYVFERWNQLWGRTDGPVVAVEGFVRTPAGQPVPQAQVLLAAHNGTPYSAESDQMGHFIIPNVPAGNYVPIAGAAGYVDRAVRQLGLMRVGVGGGKPLSIVLKPEVARPLIAPAENFHLDSPESLQIVKPIPGQALRYRVHFAVGKRANQSTLYYTPNDGGNSPLPLLLMVYPGAADEWETVSFPLAQAGFAVLAVGPEYALDLEQDVDDLERVINAAKQHQLPRADVGRIGALGGSYSSLHVLRLLERQSQPVRAALLLGPPTDLFEMRRQFTAGQIFPPFGLDKALIALGFPDRNPEPYWRYSARYHARALKVPIMLVHSKVDEIVPFQQSQLLADELARINSPHELHILEGMGHYLKAEERTPAVDELFNLTISYFQRELKP